MGNSTSSTECSQISRSQTPVWEREILQVIFGRLLSRIKGVTQRNSKEDKITEKVILVIGGTGMLGQPVSRCLKEAGFQVRIMTRDLEKGRKMFDDSFEIVARDPMDTSCLEQALNGCYGVHISLPTEAEQPVAGAVAKVASRYGVERISYILGASVAEENRWFPMVNRKFLAEKAIREAGIPYRPLSYLGYEHLAEVR